MGIAGEGRPPELIRGGWVSGSFFGVLDVAAAEGRVLTPSDYAPSAPLAVVIGRALATRLFGEASAVGRSVSIDGRPGRWPRR